MCGGLVVVCGVGGLLLRGLGGAGWWWLGARVLVGVNR